MYNDYQSCSNRQLPFKSRVDGDCIVIQCNPEEFGQGHLDVLRIDVQQIYCLLQAKAKNEKIIQEVNFQKEKAAETRASKIKSELKYN